MKRNEWSYLEQLVESNEFPDMKLKDLKKVSRWLNKAYKDGENGRNSVGQHFIIHFEEKRVDVDTKGIEELVKKKFGEGYTIHYKGMETTNFNPTINVTCGGCVDNKEITRELVNQLKCTISKGSLS